jgi:hypothetical protein
VVRKIAPYMTLLAGGGRRLGCEGVQGSVKTVLYSGEGSGSGLEFFCLAGVGYYMVLQVGWVLQRSENGGGMVADRGIGARGRA